MGVGAGPDLGGHVSRHRGGGDDAFSPSNSSFILIRWLFPGVSPPVSVSLSHLLGRHSGRS